MKSDFREEFRSLWEAKNPKKRGLLFEDLFCRLLFKSGLTVQRDSTAAKPRQTDLLAEYKGDTFLFELKWLGRKLDIAAIGQIKDRLARTTKNTIGCICSASGFTETLVKDVAIHRSQFEILLFNPYEIYALFAGQIEILDLIDRKRRALNHDGRAWFFGQDQRYSQNRYVEMPPSQEELGLRDLSVHFQLESERLSDILFSRTPLIFNEYLWAISLRVRLDASSVDALREMFLAAENYLGLHGAATFGIRQQSSGWYGLGSENFLAEIARHSKRYARYTLPIHHSEELSFFDELRNGGLFFLNARQSLTRRDLIHSAEVIIRQPGIPTDTEPYQRFIRSVTTDEILFSPEKTIRSQHAHLHPPVRVKVRDLLTTVRSNRLGGVCVSGIVIRNPFFRDPAKLTKFSKADDLVVFCEPEYLICTLDDWLDDGDEVDHYILTSLEMAKFGEMVLLHPRCTWGNLTSRALQTASAGLGKIEATWNQQDRMLNRIKQMSKIKPRRS